MLRVLEATAMAASAIYALWTLRIVFFLVLARSDFAFVSPLPPVIWPEGAEAPPPFEPTSLRYLGTMALWSVASLAFAVWLGIKVFRP